jgi:hypothetical protein
VAATVSALVLVFIFAWVRGLAFDRIGFFLTGECSSWFEDVVVLADDISFSRRNPLLYTFRPSFLVPNYFQALQ